MKFNQVININKEGLLVLAFGLGIVGVCVLSTGCAAPPSEVEAEIYFEPEEEACDQIHEHDGYACLSYEQLNNIYSLLKECKFEHPKKLKFKYRKIKKYYRAADLDFLKTEYRPDMNSQPLASSETLPAE